MSGSSRSASCATWRPISTSWSGENRLKPGLSCVRSAYAATANAKINTTDKVLCIRCMETPLRSEAAPMNSRRRSLANISVRKYNHMQTLADLVPKIVNLAGREAIRWTNGFTTTTLTYGDLYGKIGACTRYLDEKGLKKGDRVIIQSENRPEWVAFFWACISRGILMAPVDAGFSAELRDRISSDFNARLLIDRRVMEELRKRPPTQDFFIVASSPDDIVEVVYTSG